MENKRAPVIVVECEKGGVGKTTVAATLSAGLANRGLTVVAVDMDSQGSLSILFGHPRDNGLYRAIVDQQLEGSMYGVLANHWQSVVPTAGNLYLLPGAELTARIPGVVPDDGYIMLDLMDAIRKQLSPDVIIVDTSPSISQLTTALRLATDHLIYVAECEPLAMDGLNSAIKQMMRQAEKRGQHFGRETSIMGIVPNKLKPKTTLHRELVRQLGEAHTELVWPPIFDRIAWANATYFKVPVFVSEPNGEAAKDAWKLVDKAWEVLNAHSL